MKIISHKITNKKVGHIILEFSPVMCPIFLFKTENTNAKAKGVRVGRPPLSKDDIPQVFYRHYPAYKSKQLNVSELARVCDMSRTTVYRYIEVIER